MVLGQISGYCGLPKLTHKIDSQSLQSLMLASSIQDTTRLPLDSTSLHSRSELSPGHNLGEYNGASPWFQFFQVSRFCIACHTMSENCSLIYSYILSGFKIVLGGRVNPLTVAPLQLKVGVYFDIMLWRVLCSGAPGQLSRSSVQLLVLAHNHEIEPQVQLCTQLGVGFRVSLPPSLLLPLLALSQINKYIKPDHQELVKGFSHCSPCLLFHALKLSVCLCDALVSKLLSNPWFIQ